MERDAAHSDVRVIQREFLNLGWSIEVNLAFQTDAKLPPRTPIHEIQIVIILDLRGIQDSIRNRGNQSLIKVHIINRHIFTNDVLNEPPNLHRILILVVK